MPQMSAARFPIPFSDVTYYMSPLTDRDIDELDNWLRASYLQMARNSLEGVTDQELRRETLQIAMDHARTLSWMQGEGSEIAGTLEGITRVLWQGMRHNHPELAYETLREKMRDPLNAEYALTVWRELNLGKTEKNDVKDRAKKLLTRNLKRPAPRKKRSTRR